MVEFWVVTLIVTIFVLTGCIIHLLMVLNQIDEELQDLKQYIDNLEIVIHHKIQCAEAERQEILEKLERHIRYHN